MRKQKHIEDAHRRWLDYRRTEAAKKERGEMLRFGLGMAFAGTGFMAVCLIVISKGVL